MTYFQQEKNSKNIYNHYIKKQFLKYKDNIIKYQNFNDVELSLDLINHNNWYFDDFKDIVINELENRCGYVYIMSNNMNDYFKVGMTKYKNPYDRLRTVNSAGVFYELSFVGESFYYVKDVFLETVIHQDLKKIITKNNQELIYKEFFNLPLNLIEHVINENIKLFDDFLEIVLGKYY